jgi:hypothetical protein
MNIMRATAARLLSTTSITSIVGDKIYRHQLADNQEYAPPHIIIDMESNDRVYDHDGYSGLSEAYLQISCFSYDPDQSDTIATLVQSCLEAWPSTDTNIDSVFVDDRSDGYEKDTKVHANYLIFSISYFE